MTAKRPTIAEEDLGTEHGEKRQKCSLCMIISATQTYMFLIVANFSHLQHMFLPFPLVCNKLCVFLSMSCFTSIARVHHG